jgi:hypothetical protein
MGTLKSRLETLAEWLTMSPFAWGLYFFAFCVVSFALIGRGGAVYLGYIAPPDNPQYAWWADMTTGLAGLVVGGGFTLFMIMVCNLGRDQKRSQCEEAVSASGC